MILLVVAGAAVLAMVSWAALREAQRMPQALPSRRTRPSPAGPRPRRRTPPGASHPPAPVSEPWHVSVQRDVTVAEADTAEALAAAGALWHLMVREHERSG